MSGFDRSVPPPPAAVRQFRFPELARDRLGNGLTVLSTVHSELPLVTLLLVVQAGGEHDRPATAGLAQLTAHALEAGTASRSADRVAWEFELLGAELDVNVGWDAATLAVTVPQANAERALALLAEIITAPAFDPREIERLKAEQIAELEQRRADPRLLAADAATRFIFTPDTPYARPLAGQAAAVRNLTPDHVREFYHRHWVPSGAALITVGNLPAHEVSALARHQLEDWSGAPPVHADFDVATSVERVQIFIVDRAGSVQSELRVGHPGLARTTPDYFALQIGNGVLGGVFTSRLNLSLREKHGFTYGVRSGFAFRKKPGPFLIQTAVASEVTARALHEMLAESNTLIENGASEAEIVATREYLAGVMPLEMQTTEQMAYRIGDIFTYGLADDYMQQHRAALLAVTPDDANRALRAHITPQRFAITIVGDAKAIESDIAALDLGPIEVHSADV